VSSKIRLTLVCSLALGIANGFALGDDVKEAAPAAGTGVVRGHLTIDGKTVHHRFAIDESLVNLKGDALKKLAKVPAEPALMDQNGIAYVPTVLAIVAGTTVEFRNSDPTTHNVHCTCRLNAPSNIGMKQGETSKVVFDQPETIEVTCNIHANMKAFIVVLDNPFFAKVDKSGEFRIEGVPAGDFEIRGWHDGTTPTVKKVTVKAGEETVVDLDLTTKKRGR
jgi:plastocyanin